MVAVFENGYAEYNELVRNFELLIKITYGNIKIFIKYINSVNRVVVMSKYEIMSS